MMFISVAVLIRCSKKCNVTFIQIYSDEERHLHDGWPEGEDIFSKCSLLGEIFPLMLS